MDYIIPTQYDEIEASFQIQIDNLYDKPIGIWLLTE